MISSVTPSLKYSFSLSGLIFTKGSTAMLFFEIISEIQIFKKPDNEIAAVKIRVNC
jgi:TRAP-type C4-dicarboxylate transport system permease small subunit